MTIIDKLQNTLTTLFDRPNIDELFSASGMKFNPKYFGKLNRSFFPYGKGVNNPDEFDKVLGGLMIVGADFGIQRDIDTAIEKGGDEFAYNKTFKNLLLVEALRQKLDNVFFTNFGIGVRKDVDSNTKRSASLKVEYAELCSTFLLKQIAITQPKVVVLMSKEVVRNFSKYFEPLPREWSKSNFSFKRMLELEKKGLGGMSKSVRFDSLNREVLFVTSPHSCDLRNFSDKYVTLMNILLGEFVIWDQLNVGAHHQIVRD